SAHLMGKFLGIAYRMMPSSSAERELLPLSYLSQYGYCPRRCALLLLEQVWTENEYTAAGRAEHERVHTTRIERRGDLITLYEFPVFSRDLGVSGFCDCVELRGCTWCSASVWHGFLYTLSRGIQAWCGAG
ncbi:MAG: hypothetical protein RSD23_07985, partial [Ruthenibacterium sp.]